jgi:DNA replication protein DnaC
MLWGEPGTGKTGLAIATMREVVARHGADAWFTTVPDLLDEIRATYDQPRKRQVMHAKDDIEEQVTTRQLQDAVRDVTLLVLDDLGVEKPSDWVIEELYKLLNHRHNDNKRTIFTSNLNPSKLEARIGNRIVWRLVKMCGRDGVRHVVGPNLRAIPE